MLPRPEPAFNWQATLASVQGYQGEPLLRATEQACTTPFCFTRLLVPVGTAENSPAFQRWDLRPPLPKVPVGTKENAPLEKLEKQYGERLAWIPFGGACTPVGDHTSFVG
jgi:hypothetical protein